MTKCVKIKEKYGITGKINTFASTQDANKILRLTPEKQKSNFNFFYNFCRQIFLPQGYPHSVSSDYFEYQFYDTIQAFCSRLTGTISTKAILKSVGVGNAEASVVSAAILWIFKDGVGLFSAIFFAYLKGTEFDTNCKKWRLFADILNDFAMFLEVILPHITGNFTMLICLTTSMKSLVGVAGSATRAAVIQHQSKVGNAADVTAKDGSQETAVNLVASVLGIFLLSFVEDSNYEMSLFLLFCCLHIFANYWAVKSLIFKSLNAERFIIICKNYIRFDSIPNLLSVNRKESVFLWGGNSDFKFCEFQINMGASVNNSVQIYSKENLVNIINIYKNDYFIIPNVKHKKINVLFKTNVTNTTIFTSYFHALILGLGYHIFNETNLEFLNKTTAKNSNLLQRLKTKLYESKIKNEFDLLTTVYDFVQVEGPQFLEELEIKGWDLNSHSINIDDWRLENLEFYEL